MPYTFRQLTITDMNHIATQPARPSSGDLDPASRPGRPPGEGPVLRRSVQTSPDLRRELRVAAAALGVPASVVARRAIDTLLDSAAVIDRSPAAAIAGRTARLTIAAPVWWWSRFRAAAAEAEVAQHELVHTALTSAFTRR